MLSLICDKTLPSAKSQASTSRITGLDESMRTRIKAIVDACFKHSDSSTASEVGSSKRFFCFLSRDFFKLYHRNGVVSKQENICVLP